MQIDIKDNSGRPRLTVHLDPARPPTVVTAEDGRGPAVSLNWDRALDDSGQLRHCPVCGCQDLYSHRPLPRITVFVGVIGFAVAGMLGFGLGGPWRNVAIILLLLVLAMDLCIWLTVKRRLTCYRCNAQFSRLPIRPRQRPWDANTAQRHAKT